MLGGFLKNIFGSSNDRELRKLRKTVNKINQLETDLESLTVEQLQQKTVQLKQRAASGESLDQLLPEAFATVREAAKQVLGMRHVDVRLIGGIALHQGEIAEMRTGEGKTPSSHTGGLFECSTRRWCTCDHRQ